MPSRGSFLRQLSGREGWKSSSKRNGNGVCRQQMEEGLINMVYGSCSDDGTRMRKKRVMVVVDHTSHSKHAMMWALTHVANNGDLFTLLHVIENPSHSSYYLVNSLGSFCKASKPEVEVEALVIQGPKQTTVLSQVKKLEVSVLVLGQEKPSPLFTCICGGLKRSRTEELVEECIKKAECWTIGVRKQSKGMGGYLINTRWHTNFWLLA